MTLLWTLQYVLMACAAAALLYDSRLFFVIFALLAYLPMGVFGKYAGITKSLFEDALKQRPIFVKLLFNASVVLVIASLMSAKMNLDVSLPSEFLSFLALILMSFVSDLFLLRHYLKCGLQLNPDGTIMCL